MSRLEMVKSWVSRDNLRKAPRMLIAVIMMGVCVALLQMTAFGPDPCSTMNYGVARLIGIPFGVYQMSLNIAVFIIVFFVDCKQLGLGSFGNMILVGYAADFTTWFVGRVFNITAFTDMTSRVAVMIIALAVFVCSAAVYMNCGLGTAPYDAVSYLVHKKIFTDKGKKVPFKVTRIAYDGIAALIGFITGGGVGIVTLIMIPALGTAVDGVGKLMKRTEK